MQRESERNSRRAEIMERILSFPAMPAMCGRMLDRVNDPDVDFRALAEELRYDPGMTANVLKLANSAHFGAQHKVDSLQAAFVRLGMKQVFQLMVADSVAPSLSQTMTGYNLRPDELLRHSVWTAVASEEIARALDLKLSDMLFTCGLLHDLGKVVMDDAIGESLAKLDDDNPLALEGRHFDEIEMELCGITHAEAGAEIMSGWNFPRELVMAVRWHHQPHEAADYRVLASTVHIADILAYAEGIGTGIDGMKYSISEGAVTELGMSTPMLERIASQTLDKMNELERILSK